MRIAVISDTHHLLRQELLPKLQGVDHILHAGDVGDIDILHILNRIAPTTAIRGNIDTHGPTAQLPATEILELAGHLIYMLHSIHDLDLKPAAAQISIVVSGHSHKPSIETHQSVLYLNPGSIGPRRFNLPITFAILTLEPPTPAKAEIIPLTPGP
jgi:putative phosphoesterase